MKSRSPDIHALSEGDRWVVLARYLDGESDAEEADAVRRWLEANPGCADLIGAPDPATPPPTPPPSPRASRSTSKPLSRGSGPDSTNRRSGRASAPVE